MRLKSETLTITEISEGGSVPTLKLSNKTGQRVFLMAGEQLIGSKQNRVLNTSLLVEADAEIPIPVSCVEQGRWSYRSEKFTSHGTSSPGELRKMMSRDVSRYYLINAAPASDQGMSGRRWPRSQPVWARARILGRWNRSTRIMVLSSKRKRRS